MKGNPPNDTLLRCIQLPHPVHWMASNPHALSHSLHGYRTFRGGMATTVTTMTETTVRVTLKGIQRSDEYMRQYNTES